MTLFYFRVSSFMPLLFVWIGVKSVWNEYMHVLCDKVAHFKEISKLCDKNCQIECQSVHWKMLCVLKNQNECTLKGEMICDVY